MTPVVPRPRAAAGFTLLEMMVAMGLVSILLILALDAFDMSQRTTRRNLAVGDAQQGGSYALQEAALNIRRAGFMTGGNFAVVRNAGKTPGAPTNASPLASWNNYDPGTTGTTIAGTAVGDYKPVAGTDGITVRYADMTRPPLHVCYQPSSTTLDLVTNTAYMSGATYPLAPTSFDLVTSNLTCYGNGSATNTTTLPIDNTATDVPRVNVTAVAFGVACNNGGAAGANGDKPPWAVWKDAACAPVRPPNNNAPAPASPKCVRVTLDAPLACDAGDRAARGSNNVLLVPSRTISFWISTEDRSGNAAQSRPVLVSRITGETQMANPLLNAPTRVLASDIEDLQIVYYRTTTLATAPPGALVLDGDVSGDVLPTNQQMGLVRGIRFDLVARTAVTDLMYKNPAYCRARAALRPLFSRPAIADHAGAAAGTSDDCDGFRRTVFTQLIQMPNTTSLPNGFYS